MFWLLVFIVLWRVFSWANRVDLLPNPPLHQPFVIDSVLVPGPRANRYGSPREDPEDLRGGTMAFQAIPEDDSRVLRTAPRIRGQGPVGPVFQRAGAHLGFAPVFCTRGVPVPPSSHSGTLASFEKGLVFPEKSCGGSCLIWAGRWMGARKRRTRRVWR
jgi:hypothetical protein